MVPGLSLEEKRLQVISLSSCIYFSKCLHIFLKPELTQKGTESASCQVGPRQGVSVSPGGRSVWLEGGSRSWGQSRLGCESVPTRRQMGSDPSELSPRQGPWNLIQSHNTVGSACWLSTQHIYQQTRSRPGSCPPGTVP